MGYKLRTREYDYNESLFKELGIEAQEVKGRNFLEISNLIIKKYKKLSLKLHPDKPGGSTQKMQAINEYKTGLLKYTKPLNNGENLIIVEEMQRYGRLAQQSQNDKHIKCYTIFRSVNLLLLISLLVSSLYLGFRLFKAANFTNASGILFSASLITAVTTFLLISYLIVSIVKKAVNLQNTSQEQGENLDQEKLQEAIQSENRKYKFLTFISQYGPYLSCALLVAGLGLQYQSGCVDSRVLIGFVAVLGCLLIKKLATEIYERKVVDLVKTEGMGTEQRSPVGMLTEKPSSTVNPDSAFNASVHGVS